MCVSCSSPLVSVVIPAYNAAQTAVQCVESVLSQTYDNIEVIVIDDGSDDGTGEMLKRYKDDNNIDNIQIVIQSNSGPSAARNLGIKFAKGEYIAFLDVDDLWKPNKIKRQIEVFQKNPSIFLLGTLSDDFILLNETTEISLHKLMYHNYYTTSTVMCRKSVFDTLKFNYNQKYSEDYRLWIEITAQYGNGMVLNDNLVIWADKKRYGETGLSANIWGMEKGELSNYLYIYRKSNITFYVYLLASFFSFVKFVVRFLKKHTRV